MTSRLLRGSLTLLLAAGLAACGTDAPVKNAPDDKDDAGTQPHDGGTMTGMDAGNSASDMGVDIGSDLPPEETCEDGIANQDETDVDCGGATCEACELDATCVADQDCASERCAEGVCAVPLLELGAVCTAGDECLSGDCQPFGETSYCTQACTGTCPGQNLACFRDLCTPETYCDDPDGDGYGFGPGCTGEPCDICDDNATCAEDDDGNFSCICNDGWSGDGSACTDVDECTDNLDDCDANATCTNVDGTFECACNIGYVGDGKTCQDIDECTDGSHTCDTNATCSNLMPGFECACDSGWTGDGMTCADVDECATGADNCNSNASCTNVDGGFTCQCDAGYVGDGAQCADVNECTAGTDNCDPNASCNNTVGSFNCVCGSGYTGDGTTCTDIDECATDPCDSNATCLNSDGAFSCTCDDGYAGNGFSCSDVDECANPADNDCDSNATCQNTVGAYTCTCADGFTGDGTTCTDINECLANPCDANAACENTPGGFTCTCDDGYAGDGTTCVDVNECSDPSLNTCDANALCFNIPGGYSCACGTGYTGDGYSCSDLDECATGQNSCSSDATCENYVGTYACTCNDGFTGNGFTCTDIDECSNGDAICDENATCTNEPGTYACDCNLGYNGDGLTCCPDPFVVGALPYEYSGDTTNSTNDYSFSNNSCPGETTGWGAGSNDEVFTFTPTQTAFYRLQMVSEFDGVLYVFTECDDVDNSCVEAEDSAFSSTASTEVLDLVLTAGTTYFIVVDGYTNTTNVSGPFTFSLDINECLEGTDTCQPSATCEKTIPGFDCACADGYVSDGAGGCVDIDECMTGANNCDLNATCTNTPGSFTCECDTPYTGDGLTCWDTTTLGETCANPFVIPSVPFSTSGDTTDANPDYNFVTDACPGPTSGRGEQSADEVYSFTPTQNGEYAFTVGLLDAAIYIVTDCGDIDNSCLAGAWTSGTTTDEVLTVTLTAGTTYFLIVDGWTNYSNTQGPYTLDVVCNDCL